jgi:putative toxin-antitoxin system antitoxin component (TIGR02293 family)
MRFGGEDAARLDLRSDLALADVIDEGMPTSAVDVALARGILSMEEIYELVVRKRTLQRRRNQKRLSSEETDKLARVVRGIARAEASLGDSAKTHRWIRDPNRALQGRSPMDLLKSAAGSRAVDKVLGRIEHGIHS